MARTRKILETEAMFRDFLNEVEEDVYILNGWVLNYAKDSFHKWHPDQGYRGKWRVLYTIGNSKRRMGFKDKSHECWIDIPHGTVIWLSQEGGGVTCKESQHTVVGGEGSVFIALEGDKKST